MIGKFYVGHEVILRKNFIKYEFAHNSVGCHYNNYYFVSRKVVLLQRNQDGNYFYCSNHLKCPVLDPNNFEVFVSLLECNSCQWKKEDGEECKPNAPDKVLGVVAVQPIVGFAKTSDWLLALDLIKEYNRSLEDEYVYVDDITYMDTIRKIDDGINKDKTRSLIKE